MPSSYNIPLSFSSSSSMNIALSKCTVLNIDVNVSSLELLTRSWFPAKHIVFAIMIIEGGNMKEEVKEKVSSEEIDFAFDLYEDVIIVFIYY